MEAEVAVAATAPEIVDVITVHVLTMTTSMSSSSVPLKFALRNATKIHKIFGPDSYLNLFSVVEVGSGRAYICSLPNQFQMLSADFCTMRSATNTHFAHARRKTHSTSIRTGLTVRPF